MYSTMNPWATAPPPPGTQSQYGFVQTPPAYTPVQVRSTFASAPIHYAPQMMPQAPPPPKAEPEPPRQKVVWPESVRNYVQRSFADSNMSPDVERSEIEIQLKNTITLATSSPGGIEGVDWDNLPLPQAMIRSERSKQATLTWQHESLALHNGGIVQPNNQNSKKRKSREFAEDNTSAGPPWRTANTRTLEERMSSKPRIQDEKPSKSHQLLEKRQKRFQNNQHPRPRSVSPPPIQGPVVGTSTVLEKRYLRLTSAPDPALVRPEPILRQTLELLKKKWKKEQNYNYICDQFKSMRQDLTVQHIKNDFTIMVYEIHARIALEKGDLGEYNQCQTQLRALYEHGPGGNPVEFKAYRILYFIHTSNRTSLNDVLAELTPAEKEDKVIKHALNVRSALALGNYHRFFRLYLDTPNMGAYLMDMFVVRERLAALANICKVYKPDVKLRFITEELAFESDTDAAQFICDYDGQHLLQEKDDGLCFLAGQARDLFENHRRAAFQKVDIKGQI